MERSNTSLNGHKAAVIDKKLVTDIDTLEKLTASKTSVLTPERTAPLVPDTGIETEKPIPQPPQDKQKRRPIALILAALGVGAIAAGSFGYRWWQYASTHEETDNATVAGHIHQISSRINGTVANVLADDNQPVQKGQLLVKLDPRDLSEQSAAGRGGAFNRSSPG